MKFYVYGWIRPDTGRLFYVGKGKGGRDVRPKRGNPLFSNIVEKLKRNDLQPIIVRLHDNLTEDEAHRLEREEIARHGRLNIKTGYLANMTDGGEGTSGHVFSEDRRRRLIAALTGRKRDRVSVEKGAAKNTGKKRSPETIRRLSLSQAGKRMSADSRAKIGLAARGRKATRETREKLSLAKHKSGALPGKTSIYKGVSRHSRNNKWVAVITINRKRTYLGSFEDERGAALAYDNAAKREFGPGCLLNFPAAETTRSA